MRFANLEPDAANTGERYGSNDIVVCLAGAHLAPATAAIQGSLHTRYPYPGRQPNRGASVPLESNVMKHPRRRVTAALAGFLALALSAHGTVADGQLLARGQAVAAQKCSPCHAIGHYDPRPHDIVLPFRDFHERYPIPMLVEARESGVISGHDEMPGFDLSESEMRALLAYIDSFAPNDQRYVKP